MQPFALSIFISCIVGVLFPLSQLRISSYVLFYKFIVFTWRRFIQTYGNSLQINTNGSYLFVSQAAEAFSAMVLGEFPLMLHVEGNWTRVLRRTPGPLALTSGVTCNPIRASVSILRKYTQVKSDPTIQLSSTDPHRVVCAVLHSIKTLVHT